MGTTTAKKLEESLQQAKNLGLVEETFTIGDCEIVLRNLRPDEYEAVLSECSELEDMAYLNKFQEGHVCRSIQELNGVSLREIDFVECEEPNPKKPGSTHIVKRERHEWVRRNVLRTWSKEAVFSAYRKFSDVVILAEEKAKEGITFITPDETAEERYRRLLAEVKALEAEVPPALVTSILQENEYTHFTQEEDREVLQERLDPLVSDDQQVEETPESSVSASPSPSPTVSQTATVPEAILRRVPSHAAPEQAPVVTPAPTPVIPTSTPMASPVPSRRAAEFMAQEAEFDADLRAAIPMGVIPPGMEGAVAPGLQTQATQVPAAPPPELRKHQDAADPNAFVQILEKPPTGGLNPKFRPPKR